MTKEAIKKLIYRFSAVRSEKTVLTKLRDKSVVSFDVFETAVRRDVLSPADVFALMEKKLQQEKKFYVSAFTKLRIEAEAAACKLHPEREVTLAEIYDQMPTLSNDQRAYYVRLECETELAVSAPNLPIKRIYDVCLQQGKKVLFISDMYLPRAVIADILRKNGYDPSYLYVSCESGLRKRGGKLFSYVQQKEALIQTDWAHIGDSISADYLGARRQGILGILIEQDQRYNPYVRRKLHYKNRNYRALNHFIDTRISRYTDPYAQIGYAVLGPLLYGFSQWLEQEIPPDETIVFLAREGRLLQRAFAIVSKRSSVYMHVSRHALNSVRIDRIQAIEDLLQSEINVIKRYSRAEAWAKMYGLTESDIKKIFQEEKLDANSILSNENDKKRLLRAIWPAAKSNVQGQFALFRTYLKQLGVTEKCAVVDVGWKGTMQALLCVTGLHANYQPIHWSGYYLGIHSAGNNPPYNNFEKDGFLFDGKARTHIKESVENSTLFFELLFLSTEGTTIGYKGTQGGTEPVLGESENSEEIIGMVSKIQEAGMDFVKDLTMSGIGDLLPVDAEAAVANYEALARVPTHHTLDLFRSFYSYDEKKLFLVDGEPLWYYLFHPKQFLDTFAQSSNKSWLLKNVFKIPLPYISAINLARKLTESQKT